MKFTVNLYGKGARRRLNSRPSAYEAIGDDMTTSPPRLNSGHTAGVYINIATYCDVIFLYVILCTVD